MHSLTSNFNRTYNPNVRQNALSDIKQLLTSRDIASQSKACDYIITVVNCYSSSSGERARIIEYLLENDITVFICEATSNLNFELFKSLITCLRLLWRSSRFFEEEHAAHAMAAVLRALTHYANSGIKAAIDACLHFLDDLLNGIKFTETTSALSHQSAYSAVQLLACLNSIPSHVNTDHNTVLASTLVLHALISYQPSDLIIQSSTANIVLEVLKKWFGFLMGTLNHSILIGDQKNSGMIFVLLCQLGIDALRFVTLLNRGKQKVDFVHSIVADEQEIGMLKQCSVEIWKCVQQVLSELIVFAKEHQTQLSNDDYGIFLKYLLIFFCENKNKMDDLEKFSDMMFTNGYLIMLPQVQIERNDPLVRKSSSLLLAEMLKVLAFKYLHINEYMEHASIDHIQMGLVELQYGIEKPQLIRTQLQKEEPYGLLIYLYFYCQSSENPVDTMAPLLPYLVEHVLRLPKSFRPPQYIVKALWLVFAMSAISNGSLTSLDERVYLEKATDRIVFMLHPELSSYYTHNPAILLWTFTSQRIPRYVQIQVLTEWLRTGDTLPIELTNEVILWDVLVNVLVHCTDKIVVVNCMEALQFCLNDDGKEEFGVLVWSMLPNVLSKVLINCHSSVDTNTSYILELAATLIPRELNPMICLETALLVSAIYSKYDLDATDTDGRYHFEFVCLKLSLCLLEFAYYENDNRVLLAFINRAGYMTRVLAASISTDDRVACVSLRLLAFIVQCFNKNNYQPKTILQIQTDLIIKSLYRDSTSERGCSLLQLVYVVLNSGPSTPLVLAYDFGAEPSVNQQCNALRALMFRVQMMLCCKESNPQSRNGWNTLNSIFKHAIISRNDTKLVALLTSQPWTNILIQFKLTQDDVSPEFLTFTFNWLTLLKITLKKFLEVKKLVLTKRSLIVQTLNQIISLKVEEELIELKDKIADIVKDILKCSGIKIN